MERNRGFFCERDRDIAGTDRVTTELHLCNCFLIASIKNTYASDLGVRLAGSGNSCVLAGIYFVLIRILQFPQDGVLGAALVATAGEVHDVAVHELGSVGSVQTASYEICIRQNILADKAGAVEISVRGGLYPLSGNTGIGCDNRLRVALVGSLGCGRRISGLRCG